MVRPGPKRGFKQSAEHVEKRKRFGSDHHAWKGADPDVELPHVMGHEVAGRVVEVGPECRSLHAGNDSGL